MGDFNYDEPARKKPNMDIINSINATLNKGKPFESEDDSKLSREERRKKRKSRWGGADGTEKTFIPGMPTMMPQGLNKDQEEAYLRKCLICSRGKKAFLALCHGFWHILIVIF